MAQWWQKGWVWISAAVFLAITFVMYRYGAGYYTVIETAALRAIEAKKANQDVESALQAYDRARNAPNAMIVSVVGIVGLAVILWLMRFKPF